MKGFIIKLLRERLNESSRKNLKDLEDVLLLTQNLNNDGGLFLLYNSKLKKPLGYVSFGYIPDLDVFSVGGIYSEHGYGPLLYEIVMTYIYPKGLTLSQDSGTSQDAQNVWEKFVSRGDVKKEKIIRNKPSEKEEDLISGCNEDEECLKWVNKIIELHNTKFIFSLNKEFINIKIKEGIKFINENPYLDLDTLIYSLE